MSECLLGRYQDLNGISPMSVPRWYCREHPKFSVVIIQTVGNLSPSLQTLEIYHWCRMLSAGWVWRSQQQILTRNGQIGGVQGGIMLSIFFQDLLGWTCSLIFVERMSTSRRMQLLI